MSNVPTYNTQHNSFVVVRKIGDPSFNDSKILLKKLRIRKNESEWYNKISWKRENKKNIGWKFPEIRNFLDWCVLRSRWWSKRLTFSSGRLNLKLLARPSVFLHVYSNGGWPSFLSPGVDINQNSVIAIPYALLYLHWHFCNINDFILILSSLK